MGGVTPDDADRMRSGERFDPEDDTEPTAGADARSVASIMIKRLEVIEQGVPRIPTHFRLFDQKVGGLPVRGLTVIGAPPKGSKTTWTRQVAVEHVRAGGIALVYDFENGADLYLRRILCSEARLAPSWLKRGLSSDELRRWRDAQATVINELRELYLITDRHTGPDQMAKDVDFYLERAGSRPLLVVVDSLQKLNMPDLSDRRAAIDTWVRVLEDLKNTRNVALLVISELKRPQSGSRYQATGTSFKESGDIEYSADLALTLESEADTTDEAIEDEARREFGEWSLMRVQYAREGSPGRVARYRACFPFYGIEEGPLLEVVKTGRKKKAAADD